MNIRRLHKLVSILEAPQRRDMPEFNMGSYFLAPDGLLSPRPSEVCHLENYCGTTACVAGYAVVTWPQEVKPLTSWFGSAQKILDLTCNQADKLFMGLFSKKRLSEITRWEAAAEIRRLTAQDQRERRARRDKGRKRSGKRRMAV